MKKSREERSLHSGNVLPRPESLKRTIQGSIDLTNDSAERLTELEGKQLPGSVTLSEVEMLPAKGAPEARDSKGYAAAALERSPFEDT